MLESSTRFMGKEKKMPRKEFDQRSNRMTIDFFYWSTELRQKSEEYQGTSSRA